MERKALRLTIVVAGLAAAASIASAQTLKAEIPFAFQASGAKMQPGTYLVKLSRASGGTPIVQIQNVEHGRSILTMPYMADSVTGYRDAQPSLSFACTEGRCELASVRDASATVYSFPKHKAGPETRTATVLLRSDRAD